MSTTKLIQAVPFGSPAAFLLGGVLFSVGMPAGWAILAGFVASTVGAYRLLTK